MKKHALVTIREIASILVKDKHEHLREIFTAKKTLSNHKCYVNVVDLFVSKCINLNNEYAMKNLNVFVNLCESGIHFETIMNAIDAVC